MLTGTVASCALQKITKECIFRDIMQKLRRPSLDQFLPRWAIQCVLQICHRVPLSVAENFTEYRVVGYPQLATSIGVRDIDNLYSVSQNRDAVRF